MPSARIATFHEFWPFYVSQHLDVTCRVWHFIGTTSAILCLTALLVTGRWYFVPLALVSSYGCAWIGHYGFERNRPAAFQYPFWSLLADLIMYGKMWTGRMEAEIRALKSA